MIALSFGHLCDYATLDANGKLLIIGIWDVVFDQMKARPIPLPSGFIVARLECSIADGSEHLVELAMVDEDEGNILDPAPIGRVPFSPTVPGRPLQAQFMIQTAGLKVPELGDYAIEIRAGGQRVGLIPFSVVEPLAG